MDKNIALQYLKEKEIQIKEEFATTTVSISMTPVDNSTDEILCTINMRKYCGHLYLRHDFLLVNRSPFLFEFHTPEEVQEIVEEKILKEILKCFDIYCVTYNSEKFTELIKNTVQRFFAFYGEIAPYDKNLCVFKKFLEHFKEEEN